MKLHLLKSVLGLALLTAPTAYAFPQTPDFICSIFDLIWTPYFGYISPGCNPYDPTPPRYDGPFPTAAPRVPATDPTSLRPPNTDSTTDTDNDTDTDSATDPDSATSTTEDTDTTPTSGWYLSALGESCDLTCAQTEYACHSNAIRAIVAANQTEYIAATFFDIDCAGGITPSNVAGIAQDQPDDPSYERRCFYPSAARIVSESQPSPCADSFPLTDWRQRLCCCAAKLEDCPTSAAL